MLEMGNIESPKALLKTLTASLISAASNFPPSNKYRSHEVDGISLLDIKNDLLLSYLQNVVLLIILKLRDQSAAEFLSNAPPDLARNTVQELVGLRTYLEKGVRPLEGRLKYQIEKVLAAANNADRAKLQNLKATIANNDDSIDKTPRSSRGSDISNADFNSASNWASSKDRIAPAEDMPSTNLDELSYRPNPSALRDQNSSASAGITNARASTNGADGEFYRPPHITPTSMPDHSSSRAGRSARSRRRARKSHLLDEYVSTELSSLPVAEPSIGTNATILARGRHASSTRDRERDKDWEDYEERNFVRLAKQGKSEKRIRGRGSDRGASDRFGGEDWTGLGEIGDRVARTLETRESKDNVLKRRAKRNIGNTDAGNESSVALGIGQGFEKRRKILQTRAEKKKTKET